MTGINIGSLVASIGADVGPLREAIKDAERDIRNSSDAMSSGMQRFSESLQKAGREVTAVGKSLTKYITLPMLAVGAGAFKLSKDFEASMSKIVGLVGVAQDQVDEWSKDIIKMAPEVARTPKELADAMFFVTSAGLRGAEAMDVLTASAKGASAGLGETKMVADIITSAVNAYGSANLSASEAADILVGAVREGKAEASELASSLGRVLPIASEMGVTFDQVGAATAAMTRTGTDASTAATQLRAIMVGLLKPSKQAEDALQGMGTSAQDLRRIIREDGLLAAMQQIRELTNQYGEDAMSQVFPNIRALAGILDIMGSNMEENIAIAERMADTNGLLEDAFDAAADTLEFRWNQALSAGQATLVELGSELKSVFVPILEKLMNIFASLTQWFQELSESQRKWVVQIGLVVTALGPLLVTLGFLMTTVVPGLIRAFGGLRLAFISLRATALKFQAALMMNPIFALATALAAAYAAMGIFRRRTDEATEAQWRLGDALKDVNTQLGRQIYDTLTGYKIMVDGTLKAAGGIDNLAKSITELTKEELESLRMYLEDEIPRASRAAENATNDLTRAVILQDIEEHRKSLSIVVAELEKFKINTDEVSDSIAGTTITLNQFDDALKQLRVNEIELISADALQRLRDAEQSFIGFSDIIKEETQRMGALAIVMNEYSDAMRIAGMQHRVFGEEFDLLNNQIALTEQAIVSLLTNGFTPADEQVQKLIERLRILKNSVQDVSKTAIDWESIMTGAASSIGMAFMSLATTGKRSTSEIIKQLLSQVTAQLISQIVTKMPFPTSIPLAMGAGALAGLLFNQIPSFSEGGILSSRAIIEAGEYPGVRSNPEVIAPLDKLQDMLGTTNMAGDVRFIIEDDKLVGLLEIYERKKINFG